MIQTLDLSNNNLTGPIPDFLSQLPDLNVINLEKNKLTGSVPVGLIERRKNGFLSLSLCANPNLSGNVSCKKKRNFVIPVVASVAGISILLLSVAALYWGIKRKRQPGAVTGANPIIAPVEATKRQFTYSEILQITNNLKRILGKGGFGTVYHGCLDKTQVAVKMLSPSSVQGLQQFHAEVNLLMRVHHINLTSLVGYCNDENHIGLVYEYMENGNLQAYLSDSTPVVLTWEGRLQIATDAAQGLEYLHYCCSPPMIHRDVKSTNILLNEYFQAKLSDFGLSRNFPVEDGTHILTGVAGTPGYLAPEYNMSNRLNEKSDVYSFGVVLLEIIAGRPAFINTHERIHISKWVGLLLPKGDIYSIVDPRLERRFNVSSVWKAVELAMACVSKNPINRPSMSQVLVELKECLATELARTKQSGNHTEKGNSIEMMSQNSIAMLRPSVR
ncbi:PREDICTED: probable [Prunus dulcis]|uniref:PREDICTED: probable n=1 Tax=Prunus dulcis TaxID=3755 RepID=A0A5E4F8Q8_PRUDU|nr:PREDICTED: probable [Prunus dulcis]